MGLVARFRNHQGHMVRDDKGPWVLVSALEHYRRRMGQDLARLEGELGQRTSEFFTALRQRDAFEKRAEQAEGEVERVRKHHEEDLRIAVQRIEKLEGKKETAQSESFDQQLARAISEAMPCGGIGFVVIQSSGGYGIPNGVWREECPGCSECEVCGHESAP